MSRGRPAASSVYPYARWLQLGLQIAPSDSIRSWHEEMTLGRKEREGHPGLTPARVMIRFRQTRVHHVVDFRRRCRGVCQQSPSCSADENWRRWSGKPVLLLAVGVLTQRNTDNPIERLVQLRGPLTSSTGVCLADEDPENLLHVHPVATCKGVTSSTFQPRRI